MSLGALCGIALAVSYWTGFVHGSSTMTARDLAVSIVLPIIFLLTVAKLTFAFIFRQGRMPPASGGSPPPSAPPPGVRAPRPPGAPPEIYCEHAL